MKIRLVLLLAFSFAVMPQLAVSAPINVELVVNGGAETGDITGWVDGGIEAYAHNGSDPDSQGFGNYAFTPGAGLASGQTLSQSIDLTGNATAIDQNQLNFAFSVQLQSRFCCGALDRAIAELFFKDASGTVLQDFYFEDTINTAAYDWNLFTVNQALLAGTRSAEIVLTGTRSAFGSTDSYFDEVSFLLLDDSSPQPDTSAPLPDASGVALTAFGLVGLACFGRRKFKR